MARQPAGELVRGGGHCGAGCILSKNSLRFGLKIAPKLHDAPAFAGSCAVL
jgi:hypothetical protein